MEFYPGHVSTFIGVSMISWCTWTRCFPRFWSIGKKYESLRKVLAYYVPLISCNLLSSAQIEHPRISPAATITNGWTKWLQGGIFKGLCARWHLCFICRPQADTQQPDGPIGLGGNPFQFLIEFNTRNKMLLEIDRGKCQSYNRYILWISPLWFHDPSLFSSSNR